MDDGIQRGRAASTIFYHPKRRISTRMCEWYYVKVRGILGGGRRGVHETEILDRRLRRTEEGLEHEASDKHR